MSEETEPNLRTKANFPFRQLAIEFLSILFAVSLALTANEWRQYRNNKALAKQVIITLKDEIEKNQISIGTAADYHKSLISELQNGTHLIARFPYKTDKTKNLQEFKKDLYRLALETGAAIDKDMDIVPSASNTFLLSVSDQVTTIKVKNDSLYIYGSGNIQLHSANINNTSWEVAQATQAVLHIDYEIVELFSELYQYQETYLQTVNFTLQILYTGSGSILSTLQDMYYYEKLLLEKYETLLSKIEEKSS